MYLGLLVFTAPAYAVENPFFSSDWWQSATLQSVEDAIKHGADVKERDNNGGTSLMYAAFNSKTPEIIETLIRHGADVKERNNDGKTALDYAKDNPHIYKSKAYRLMNDKMYE